MVHEAEANAEADQKRKDDIEVRNRAEQLIADLDLQLQEQGDKMDPSQKEQVQQMRDEFKTALDNNDIETLKNRMNELEQLMANMQYQAGSNNGDPTDGGTTPGSNPDDVVDADFTSTDGSSNA